MSARMGAHHDEAERREIGEARAQRILSKESKRWGWQAAKLKQLANGDAERIKIAGRLRSETTKTWSWIGAHLRLATAGLIGAMSAPAMGRRTYVRSAGL